MIIIIIEDAVESKETLKFSPLSPLIPVRLSVDTYIASSRDGGRGRVEKSFLPVTTTHRGRTSPWRRRDRPFHHSSETGVTAAAAAAVLEAGLLKREWGKFWSGLGKVCINFEKFLLSKINQYSSIMLINTTHIPI